MKILIAAALATTFVAGAVRAEDYGQYPAPLPGRLAPLSRLTGEVVLVAPYGYMPVRAYATPQTGPYYNVPPYPVIAPY